jgi:hypothetical protein
MQKGWRDLAVVQRNPARASDAGRLPLRQRADPVAESDLAEVATGID